MTRANWQGLTRTFLAEAQALLAAGLWGGAYYVAGYVVESGLKACVMKRLESDLGLFYRERNLQDRAWRHTFLDLLTAAGLTAALDAEVATNAAFRSNWDAVKGVVGAEPVRPAWRGEGEEVSRRDHRPERRSAAMDREAMVLTFYERPLRELGLEILRALVHAGFDVSAAGWMQPGSNDWWFVVVSRTPETDTREMRLKAYEAMDQAGIPRKRQLPLTLTTPDDSLGRDFLRLRRGDGGSVYSSYEATMLGGHEVEAVWLYPDEEIPRCSASTATPA